MKEEQLDDISVRLAALGFAVQRGNGTDIAIASELLDTGWSTGEKRIDYEAYILADEPSRTVLMHERTTERGRGFSFGFSFGTTTQRGKTEFGLVSQSQYGPEGKVYEYSFDLGAIPRGVIEAAKAHGWKFRSVIRKAKAMYPGQ